MTNSGFRFRSCSRFCIRAGFRFRSWGAGFIRAPLPLVGEQDCIANCKFCYLLCWFWLGELWLCRFRFSELWLCRGWVQRALALLKLGRGWLCCFFHDRREGCCKMPIEFGREEICSGKAMRTGKGCGGELASGLARAAEESAVEE